MFVGAATFGSVTFATPSRPGRRSRPARSRGRSRPRARRARARRQPPRPASRRVRGSGERSAATKFTASPAASRIAQHQQEQRAELCPASTRAASGTLSVESASRANAHAITGAATSAAATSGSAPRSRSGTTANQNARPTQQRQQRAARVGEHQRHVEQQPERRPGERVDRGVAGAPRGQPQQRRHAERRHQPDRVPVAERLAQARERLVGAPARSGRPWSPAPSRRRARTPARRPRAPPPSGPRHEPHERQRARERDQVGERAVRLLPRVAGDSDQLIESGREDRQRGQRRAASARRSTRRARPPGEQRRDARARRRSARARSRSTSCARAAARRSAPNATAASTTRDAADDRRRVRAEARHRDRTRAARGPARLSAAGERGHVGGRARAVAADAHRPSRIRATSRCAGARGAPRRAPRPVAPGIMLWPPTRLALGPSGGAPCRASWLSAGLVGGVGARRRSASAARRPARGAAAAAGAAPPCRRWRCRPAGAREHVAAVGVLVDVGGDVLARVAQLRRRVVAADAAVLALAQDLLADARARRGSSEQQDQPAERQQTNHGLPR